MGTDIHINLTDVEATQLKRLAEREDRSVSNMVRKLLRDAMDALEKPPTRERI